MKYEATVVIDHLGGLGDGVAESASGRLHIPFTAPGDRAQIAMTGKDSARLTTVLEPGPFRAVPPCRHFGRCGGCALQHLQPGFTADWKRGRVVAALARAGLGDAMVGETVSVPPGTRRRATLAAARAGKSVLLGFTERGSHKLVDLRECWILRHELVALIPPLRERLPSLLDGGESADIALTWTDTGADLVLIRRRPLTLIDRETLAAFAEVADLARVSWRPTLSAPAEPVAARRTPVIRFGDLSVAFPPGAFLQPSIEGQAVLTTLVLNALDGVKGNVLDLFSGLGTFAAPVARTAPVSAFDSDKAAIAALRTAATGRPIQAIERDLFREPLTGRELGDFAAAVIDPPRAGAQAQVRALADSGIPLIAYVSCNPVTFARDAAILADGGYRLEQVTPVDQFLWSPHIELAGIFRR